MVTSVAGVFRTRQVMSDLTSSIFLDGRNAFRRIVSRKDPDGCLLRILFEQGGRFDARVDETVYGEVLLAAALPDEDFPAFTCATALLLLDRINDGSGEDNLYWNWEAFSDHFRMADPSVRAVIMNGFRTAAELGRVSIPEKPDPVDCLTRRPEDVLVALRHANAGRVLDAIETGATAEEAGRLWLDVANGAPTKPVLTGIRYLYERPVSLTLPDPHGAPLIPWTV